MRLMLEIAGGILLAGAILVAIPIVLGLAARLAAWIVLNVLVPGLGVVFIAVELLSGRSRLVPGTLPKAKRHAP